MRDNIYVGLVLLHCKWYSKYMPPNYRTLKDKILEYFSILWPKYSCSFYTIPLTQRFSARLQVRVLSAALLLPWESNLTLLARLPTRESHTGYVDVSLIIPWMDFHPRKVCATCNRPNRYSSFILMLWEISCKFIFSWKSLPHIQSFCFFFFKPWCKAFG